MSAIEAMARARLTRRGVLAAAPAIWLSACAGDHGPPTTALRFIVQADDSINPNAAGAPSPTLVKIYELKTLGGFMQADFFKLLDDDASALGGDLVAKRELEIKPGEKQNFERASPYDTKFIGVIAGFRSIDKATWRASAECKPGETGLYVVGVSAASIAVTFAKDKMLGLF